MFWPPQSNWIFPKFAVVAVQDYKSESEAAEESNFEENAI